jgi:hypothetical protein
MVDLASRRTGRLEATTIATAIRKGEEAALAVDYIMRMEEGTNMTVDTRMRVCCSIFLVFEAEPEYDGHGTALELKWKDAKACNGYILGGRIRLFSGLLRTRSGCRCSLTW